MEVYNNQFKYLELRDGSVIIIKYIGADNSVTVPAEINGKPVTEIDDDAFAGRENLKVSISSEVRFGKVSFAPSVTSNAQAVPVKIPQFETDSLPFDYAITITKYTGTDSSVTIPARINGKPVTKIGKRAFANCDSLEMVTIPRELSIGELAFLNCTNLKSVDISHCNIGEGAFKSCSSLISATLDFAQKIGDTAFHGCSSLESVSARYVQLIGERAFWGCTSLKEIQISASTEVADDAFENCPARIIRR